MTASFPGYTTLQFPALDLKALLDGQLPRVYHTAVFRSGRKEAEKGGGSEGKRKRKEEREEEWEQEDEASGEAGPLGGLVRALRARGLFFFVN